MKSTLLKIILPALILAFGATEWASAGYLSTMCMDFIAPLVTSPGDIVEPEVGQIVFDQTSGGFAGFNGTSWSGMGGGASIPPGTVLPFVGRNAPVGFKLCNGQQYNVVDYPALAAALWDPITGQYAFGGSGTYPSGTFNVPDFRGRFLRGVDGTAGRDPDSGTRTAMNAGGHTGNEIGSVQTDAFKAHDHTSISGNNLTYRVGITGGPNSAWFADSPGVPNTGLAGGTETRPVNAYVNYIIKL